MEIFFCYCFDLNNIYAVFTSVRIWNKINLLKLSVQVMDSCVLVLKINFYLFNGAIHAGNVCHPPRLTPIKRQ